MSEITKDMPAVALRGMTILPSMIVHFDISRERSIKAVEQAMLQDQQIFVVTQRDPDTQEPKQRDLYRVGTIAMIKQVIRLPKNIFRVLVEGIGRAELLELNADQEFLQAEVALLEDHSAEHLDERSREAMLRTIKEIFGEYAAANTKMSKELTAQMMELVELDRLVDQIAINIPLYYEEKQKILEAAQLYDRYELLCVMLSNEVEIMHIKAELQTKVKERVDKNQREYLLREQLKLIREELGEDNTFTDADHFMEELNKLEASPEVKEKIEKEISRFKSVGGNSSESSVIRGYLETLLELPWDKMSRDNTDLKNAREILEADHYGLQKVKERVLEFLAVRTLTKKGESPILCLVGPPGTGKTSIAKSIARAMNKKYVRICLGGVRDEAEIRGHRRTYVGAMPGRLANGMKMAGVKNPLMLLDEIDKVSSDYKGDTSSALLEVLDSEQNNKFRDHYVEIPLDLSEVMFIATANDLQTIPRPLLDRMELIEISSYTENEKLHIAREHLLQKQIRKHGLDQYKFTVSDGALKKIITCYTKEAGVRNLERKLGEICRKAAREILEGDKKSLKVTESNLCRYLGNERYSVNRLNEKNEIGIVRGLAWTSVGGETLQIEVNIMPGKGEIQLTGQLGDVMKESAQAGISYIRSVSREYQIPEDFFGTHDIHIHIPEGAVPKDGPSAGITMATAMISAITKTPVRADIAMTGEITLRGRVLPIGGLKEKLLAAKTAGMSTVLVPKKNKVDVEEISPEIKRGLEILFVDSMEDVLPRSLVKESV
ncbi:MAG: endopeptidase La [Lachnospiraceae bacterium]|jgi:ATP-dependent Lon protease|nr:endopeptidase La [Lachnospiraceae bacterium]